MQVRTIEPGRNAPKIPEADIRTRRISHALSTQRERDDESKLMHYRARSYDLRLGRFIQKEPEKSDLVHEHYPSVNRASR